ncbi:MAG: hypothetical protein N3A59_08500 [Thermodesulfovibrionales bacterium]|nr:hypothetical protein [Thermodesulfovibrionales bacterium]
MLFNLPSGVSEGNQAILPSSVLYPVEIAVPANKIEDLTKTLNKQCLTYEVINLSFNSTINWPNCLLYP